MEEEIVAFAKNLAETHPAYAYIFFFINAVLQILFPPYPGDSIIIFQGYLSSTGLFSSPLLLITSISATLLSSIFLYIISCKFGERVITSKFIMKFFDINKMAKLEAWFKKFGTIAIIITKFIPGVGSLILIAAGLFKLPYIPAIISISAASVLHNTILFMTGRVTGYNLYWVKSLVIEYYRFILIVLFIIIAIYVYTKYVLNRKKGQN
jgi:membrane protein DedA with SNARE-associated domain